MPARAEGRLDRRALLERQRVRQRDQSPRRGDHVLGVAARRLDSEHADTLAVHVLAAGAPLALPAVDLVERRDPVVHGDLGHVRPDGGDLAGDLEAESVRERQRQPRRAVSHVDVDVVDRACPDAYERLARPRLGNADVLEAQDADVAEFVEPDRLHRAAAAGTRGGPSGSDRPRRCSTASATEITSPYFASMSNRAASCGPGQRSTTACTGTAMRYP